MKLYYIQTVHKTEGQDEWARLMYSIVESESMGNMETKVKKGAFLLRMCVSVSKRHNASGSLRSCILHTTDSHCSVSGLRDTRCHLPMCEKRSPQR